MVELELELLFDGVGEAISLQDDLTVTSELSDDELNDDDSLTEERE